MVHEYLKTEASDDFLSKISKEAAKTCILASLSNWVTFCSLRQATYGHILGDLWIIL